MRTEFLEKNIAWNLKENIWYEEDHQRRIVFRPRLDVEILSHAEHGRIADIYP
jgi:hypothetical protein